MIARELYAHVFCAVPWNRVISYDPGSKVLTEMKGCVMHEGKENKPCGWSLVSLFGGVKDYHHKCIV